MFAEPGVVLGHVRTAIGSQEEGLGLQLVVLLGWLDGLGLHYNLLGLVMGIQNIIMQAEAYLPYQQQAFANMDNRYSLESLVGTSYEYPTQSQFMTMPRFGLGAGR